MARAKRASNQQAEVSPSGELPVPNRAKPSVFISHDTRDGDIAEAFSNLVRDASGGVLRSFRSSDRKGTSGIEFGAEWYTTIMEKLKDATDVVALLTPYSIDRPWLLYEAGVAKGKLDTVVFGVAIGVPLDRAAVGPFAQFQNSGDDEDSLTKLILQLIRRNPDADPREEAVRRQVVAFRDATSELLQSRTSSDGVHSSPEMDANAVAKLFEEVKVMFAQLPVQMEAVFEHNRRRDGGRRRSHVHAKMLRELMYQAERGEPSDDGANWLLLASIVKDAMPWLHDALLEIHRATLKGNTTELNELRERVLRTLQSRSHQMLLDHSLHQERDETSSMLLHELPLLLEYQLSRPVVKPSTTNAAGVRKTAKRRTT